MTGEDKTTGNTKNEKEILLCERGRKMKWTLLNM